MIVYSSAILPIGAAQRLERRGMAALIHWAPVLVRAARSSACRVAGGLAVRRHRRDPKGQASIHRVIEVMVSCLGWREWWGLRAWLAGRSRFCGMSWRLGCWDGLPGGFGVRTGSGLVRPRWLVARRRLRRG